MIEIKKDDLIRARAKLLANLRMTEDELRVRIRSEIATVDERALLARLEEIAFLLGESE